MAWGDSLGGLITQTLVEANPGKIAGIAAAVRRAGGPEQAFSSAMTVLYTWKTLIDPTLKVANYAAGQLATPRQLETSRRSSHHQRSCLR